MSCDETRALLRDHERGTLSPDANRAVDAHLATCAACRHEQRADRALSSLLDERLPRAAAPAALRQALEAKWLHAPVTIATAAPRSRVVARSIVAVAACMAVAAIVAFVIRARPTAEPMVAEAVNDHLRVLYGEHPLEVESGGMHQVKPWFAGRLDFAPATAFQGDDEFPLQGGAVAYFVDRKAAAYVFKRRLHTITLFVFRSEGLPWSESSPVTVGHARASARTSRGFHVLLWRDGDLGYALVSDVAEADLEALGAKIAGP